LSERAFDGEQVVVDPISKVLAAIGGAFEMPIFLRGAKDTRSLYRD
jgi:hypothetical protein